MTSLSLRQGRPQDTMVKSVHLVDGIHVSLTSTIKSGLKKKHDCLYNFLHIIHCSTLTYVQCVLYWAPENYKEVLALPSLALGLFFDLYMMFFGRPLKETPCIILPCVKSSLFAHPKIPRKIVISRKTTRKILTIGQL